jgi:hypothetical protein
VLTFIATTTSGGIPIPGAWLAILAIAFSIGGAGATYLVVGGKKGTALTDLQDKTITAYIAELTLANQKIDSLTKQVDTQETQIRLLQELVLQTAKVDDLIGVTELTNRNMLEAFKAVKDLLHQLIQQNPGRRTGEIGPGQ